MTKKRTRTAVASLALVATGLVAVPIASATSPSTTSSSGNATQSSTTFDAAKQRCLKGLDKRQEHIKKDMARVHDASMAPAADRARLGDQLAHVAVTLSQAKGPIEAATSPTALRSACKNMVTSTRVYVLYGPKTHALTAQSRLARIDARIAKHEGQADKVFERAAKRGVPADKIADAKAKLADAKQRIADAHTQVDGLAQSLLPITVAQVNDGSAKAQLAQAKSRLQAAANDAKAIRADVQAIRNDLRVR